MGVLTCYTSNIITTTANGKIKILSVKIRVEKSTSMSFCSANIGRTVNIGVID
ncbi:hypothetical protein WHE01_13740 [Weissella hellenica]|nr:hypothetical protein WHE01_13740 [Weissella hellenica]